MTHLVIDVAVALLALLMAAFFAAIQEAFSALTKGRAHKLVEDEVKGSATIADIAADPAPTVSTAQFLRLLAEVTVVIVAVDLVQGWWFTGVGALVTAGVIGVVAIFIIVSVAGRTIGQQRSTAVVRSTARLMKLLVSLLFFIPKLMIVIGNAITPGRGFPDGPFASEDELREFVDRAEASNQIEAEEKRMIYSVFDLGDTLVREVMVPRPDVVHIDADKTLRQAMSLALRSGFSRIPVTSSKGLDDVTGIVYLKDIVKRVFDAPDAQSTETVGAWLRPATWCPDSKPADDLLREMQSDHSHMAVVVDEFGGTAGIVTIEDLLEEIVGEIQDEYDREIAPATEIEPGVWRVSSRLSLADLGELFGLDLTDDDVDSVGGIMAKVLNMVPIPGSHVEWQGLDLTADPYAGRRHQIASLVVRLAADADQLDQSNVSPNSSGDTSGSVAVPDDSSATGSVSAGPMSSNTSDSVSPFQQPQED
ncbi:MAG: hemolysin family protein [Propionibacteriaceae bacterium]|jgi:CBS domain containing-hemolysin-like protein|nr:hemolysin family protein [Propionibacteriaceae bacterium]